MIIDIHTHIFPDELAERAVKTLSDRCNVLPKTDGTYKGLLDSMAKSGVDRSAIMHIATKPSQARTINKWALSLSEENEGLICFGTVHPKQKNWLEEIDWLVKNGFPGIKFHPDYQDFFVDDKEVFPLYKALADSGLIVLFHAGVDIGLPPPVHCTPDRLARVLDAFPDLKVIAAHMGGYALWDDVEKYLVGRNLYLDTSYSLNDLGKDRVTAIIKKHGPDRILFGTDSPWTGQMEEIAQLRSLDLTSAEIDGILGANAQQLLKNHI